MGGIWSVEETIVLIAVWVQESVQSKLDRVHRNRDKLQRNSWIMDIQRCESSAKIKIEKLTQRYRNVAMLCIALMRIYR